MDVTHLVRSISAVIRRIAHFLVLGSLLFAVERYALPQAAPPREAIVVSLDEVRARWVSSHTSTPTDRELNALAREIADEEILVRTAIRSNLHRSDAIVQQRLFRNMRFLEESGDPVGLVESAIELGMHRTDPVIRRRLILAIEHGLKKSARGGEPSEEELRRFAELHRRSFVDEGGNLPPFEEIRSRVRYALFAERERGGVRRAIEQLRRGFEIRLEDGP